MSSKRDFQCFVHLYDIKYKITITESHRSWMLFNDIYPKIQQLDPKQDISFETNTFEIFDSKENRFKRITSFNDIIENDSRVRVLIKPQVFKNYLYDSDKRSDVTNSYQTSDNLNLSHTFGLGLDRNSDKSQSYALNGSQLRDNYCNTFNKIDFYSNKTQLNDSRVWAQTSSSSLRGLSSGPSMSSFGPLMMSPTMVSVVEPSVLATNCSTQPSDYDWRTAYCPNKVVEYNDISLDRKYNTTDERNTNSYQSVSAGVMANTNQSNGYSSTCDPNYIMEKLIESRNIILREQSLEELRRQGVEVKQNFNFDIFLCKVCDECFQTMESALDHTRSLEHFDLKSGKFADEMDRSLVIPTEKLCDITVVLARKQELKRLELKTKYEFLRHGIRIKDGVGNDAYVCLECKVSFMSFNYVRHHLSKFKGYSQQPESEAVYSSNTFQGSNTGVRPPSPEWRQSERPRNDGPSRSGAGSSGSRRRSRSNRNRGRKRRLNGGSEVPNPEPKSEQNIPTKNRRIRRRTRNKNKRVLEGIPDQKPDIKPNIDLIKIG